MERALSAISQSSAAIARELESWESVFGPLGGAPLVPDFRDVALTSLQAEPIGAAVAPFQRDYHYIEQPWLNQGSEGACVGFGYVNFYNALPVGHTLPNAYAFNLYHEITRRDEFSGDWRTGQSGTSIRSGGKEMKRRGLIPAYAFTASIDVMLRHLRDRGPLVIGVPWFRSADKVDPKGFTRVWGNSGIRGWHCVCINGADTTSEEPHFLYPNSWGARRRFKFSMPAMQYLLDHAGAGAITAVEKVA